MRDRWFKGLVRQGFEERFDMLKEKVAAAHMKPIYDDNGLLKIPFSTKQPKRVKKEKKGSKVQPGVAEDEAGPNEARAAVLSVASSSSGDESDDSDESQQARSSAGLSEIARSDVAFEKEADRKEALEFNGMELPEDYLLARLALTEAPREFYIKSKKDRKIKDAMRRNTQCQFFQDNPFNPTEGSSQHQLGSEPKRLEDLDNGLDLMLEEFRFKTQFLQGVKDNDKVCNKQRSQASETHQKFVKNSLDYGHVPLPVLLKIKKGMMYIPSSYTVTEGLAVALKDSLKNLEWLPISQRGCDEAGGTMTHSVQQAVFDGNNMNDKVFALVLRGLKTRPELRAVSSFHNELGHQSSKQLSHLLRNINDGNQEDMPELTELTLIDNKCTP